MFRLRVLAALLLTATLRPRLRRSVLQQYGPRGDGRQGGGDPGRGGPREAAAGGYDLEPDREILARI
jgi:hypothetical protein